MESMIMTLLDLIEKKERLLKQQEELKVLIDDLDLYIETSCKSINEISVLYNIYDEISYELDNIDNFLYTTLVKDCYK